MRSPSLIVQACCSLLLSISLPGSSAVQAKSAIDFQADILNMEQHRGANALKLAYEMREVVVQNRGSTQIYQQALDAMKRVLPAGDPAITYAMYNLALVQPTDAARTAQLRQALATEEKFRPDSAAAADFVESLCACVDDTEAKKLFPRVYAIRKKRSPNDPELLNETCRRFYKYEADPATMKMVAKEWLARARKFPGSQNRSLINALEFNDKVCTEQNLVNERIPVLKQLIEVQEKSGRQTAGTRLDLADAYVAAKKFSEGTAIYENFLKLKDSYRGKADILVSLGEANAQAGNVPRAKQFYERALQESHNHDIYLNKYLKFLKSHGGTAAEQNKITEQLAANKKADEKRLENYLTKDKIKALKPPLLQCYQLEQAYDVFKNYNDTDSVDAEGLRQYIARAKGYSGSLADDPNQIRGLELLLVRINAAGKAPITVKQLHEDRKRNLERMIFLAASSKPFGLPEKALIINLLYGQVNKPAEADAFTATINAMFKKDNLPLSMSIGKPYDIPGGMFGPGNKDRKVTLKRDGKVMAEFAVPYDRVK